MQFILLEENHTENSYINLDGTSPIVIPENRPWLNPKPIFNLQNNLKQTLY